MRIGLKISRHGVVTMIFRKPFPIIGLLMEGKMELLQEDMSNKQARPEVGQA